MKKNGLIFGVNIVPEWGEPDKLYIFVEEKQVWDRGGDYSGKFAGKIYDLLPEIGLVEESDNCFSRPEKLYMGKAKYKDNVIMTREQICEKFISLGFEHNEEFEKDCVELRYP